MNVLVRLVKLELGLSNRAMKADLKGTTVIDISGYKTNFGRLKTKLRCS